MENRTQVVRCFKLIIRRLVMPFTNYVVFASQYAYVILNKKKTGLIKQISLFTFLLVMIPSCGVKPGNKASNKLLDEFRVDEYRGYVVISISKKTDNYCKVAMYNYEKKRYVYVLIPKWLSDYWQEGDTIK